MAWLKIAPGKSGAREVATSLLLLWVFLLLWCQFSAPADSFFERQFEAITTAIFLVVGGAFGVPSVLNRMGGAQAPAPRIPLRNRDPDKNVE